MHKDLVLNNPQGLICHKTQPTIHQYDVPFLIGYDNILKLGVMVTRLDEWTIIREFESYWVFHIFVLQAFEKISE